MYETGEWRIVTEMLEASVRHTAVAARQRGGAMNPENPAPKDDPIGDIVWDAIARHKGVRVWEGTDPYLYRPNQLLVDRTHERALTDLLEAESARRVRCHSREGRLLEKLGVHRWELLGPEADARRSMVAIREKAGDRAPRQAVTLSHVVAGAPIMKFGPGDLPVDGGAGPVQPERSKRPGTGKGVRVSILDTGFVKASTVKHPLLSHQYADDGDDRDDLYDEVRQMIRSVFGGHGTFVAGIIRQLAPDTDLDPEVTLDDVGLVDDMELARDILRSTPSHILNLSLAGPSEDADGPLPLRRALEHLRDRSDVVVVAAAGNDFVEAQKAGAPERPMWPAAFGGMKGFEHVVGVAAVDREREAAAFSNRGPWVRACAYGVGVRSTYVEGKMPIPASTPIVFGDHATAVWSGTSFATPRVVGAIAATMTSEGTLSPREALAEVLASGSPGPAGMGTFVE